MLDKLHQIIKRNEATFLIVKEDKVIYQDSGIGVKPIMKVINECPENIKEGIVVDKVIGKAAAMLLIKFGVKKVHGLLMSRTAIHMFEKHHTDYFFEVCVDTIQNRTNTGLCPLEDSVKDIEDLDEGFEHIKKRISELMNGTYIQK